MNHYLLILCVSLFSVFDLYSLDLVSPNEKINVTIETRGEGEIVYKIDYKNKNATIAILDWSNLGLIRSDQDFSKKLKFIGESETRSVHDYYTLIHGKKSICENLANEKTFHFKNLYGEPLDVIFRAYNDGVCFRYSFPGHSDEELRLIDEQTSFFIPEGTVRWLQDYEISYERFFPKSNSGINSSQNRDWAYPALFQKDNVFVLISEADMNRSNCATRLNNQTDPEQYKVSLPSNRKDVEDRGPFFHTPWKSPWRVLMIGELKTIVESTLITDVSEPCKINDISWIQSGAASWIYWANNHGSKDFQKVVEYVDLAKRMNWPYVLIDWEWDAMTNGGNIEDAVRYARQSGIKPIMWYNSGTAWLEPTPVDRMRTHENRVKEFEWLNRIGVVGIKVDFFDGDQQDMINYYIDILEDAAKHQLLVNFHGATIPRGLERTYPNLMTVEAVRGAEWYNNGKDFTDRAASHNATLPFTRNVIGPMDYTPVTFSNSQHPHITSYAHELALSVVFESGIQHFADKPSAYENTPSFVINFLKMVPTSWDETRLINGYPGLDVMMARRKGNDWYIGGINGTDKEIDLKLNLSFLGEESGPLYLIMDGINEISFREEMHEIHFSQDLMIHCLPRGGFVGILKSKFE